MPETTKKVAELTKDELKELVALFKEAGVEVTEKGAKLIPALEVAVDEHGYPHRVTEEDKTNNPDLADTEVGDVVLLELEDDATNDDDTPPEEPETTPKPTKTEEKKSATPKPTAVSQLYYMGKPVVRVENRIVSGKMYKEVHHADAAYTLSQAEYEEDVTTR